MSVLSTGVSVAMPDKADRPRESWPHSTSSRSCFPDRHREIEGGPLVRLTLEPDLPTVSIHDSLHQCEADADALIIFGSVQSLEDIEELISVGRVKPDAVVTDP